MAQKIKKLSGLIMQGLAVQIVLNYEEGAENCVLNGDKIQKFFYLKLLAHKPIKGRHINMESLYEYGSSRGFWRLHKIFKEKKIPVTIFGVGMALAKNPQICKALINADYEVASHGWRWIDYQNIKKSEEKKHMKMAIKTIKKYLVNDHLVGTQEDAAPIQEI